MSVITDTERPQSQVGTECDLNLFSNGWYSLGENYIIFLPVYFQLTNEAD